MNEPQSAATSAVKCRTAALKRVCLHRGALVITGNNRYVSVITFVIIPLPAVAQYSVEACTSMYMHIYFFPHSLSLVSSVFYMFKFFIFNMYIQYNFTTATYLDRPLERQKQLRHNFYRRIISVIVHTASYVLSI